MRGDLSLAEIGPNTRPRCASCRSFKCPRNKRPRRLAGVTSRDKYFCIGWQGGLLLDVAPSH